MGFGSAQLRRSRLCRSPWPPPKRCRLERRLAHPGGWLFRANRTPAANIARYLSSFEWDNSAYAFSEGRLPQSKKTAHSNSIFQLQLEALSAEHLYLPTAPRSCPSRRRALMAPSRTSPRHIAPSLDPTRIHIKDTLRFTSFHFVYFVSCHFILACLTWAAATCLSSVGSSMFKRQAKPGSRRSNAALEGRRRC